MGENIIYNLLWREREMVKNHELKYFVIIFVSVLINCFFLYHHHFPPARRSEELSWSRGAAIEAESVASISCSGHGRAYVDGVPLGGQPKCECNTCYAGKDCSQFMSDCPANADSGDPLFLEPFWMENAASSAVVVAGWHRMSYRFETDNAISAELEKHIRELHSVIGNAVTDGKFIVFGAGSTQLLAAAILSLSSDNSRSPANVVASAPFYPMYESQTQFFKSIEFKWKGEASLWKNRSDNSGTFIEFVTSPNNPDCKFKEQVLRCPSCKAIFDHAYYWPHFSAIPSAADEDLMIFTLSKLTGHAGSRFGWALIKDEKLYNKMVTFISLNSFSVSRDAQLRALKLIKVALKDKGRGLFKFGYETMRNRWERISNSFSYSKRFTLQALEPQYCNYFQNVTGPSPAYAWVKCERDEDGDCTSVFQMAGIIGRGGSVFNAGSRYVRLSLIKSQDDFDLLLQKIDAFVAKESVAASI